MNRKGVSSVLVLVAVVFVAVAGATAYFFVQGTLIPDDVGCEYETAEIEGNTFSTIEDLEDYLIENDEEITEDNVDHIYDILEIEVQDGEVVWRSELCGGESREVQN